MEAKFVGLRSVVVKVSLGIGSIGSIAGTSPSRRVGPCFYSTSAFIELT